jgi:hypothetical protein
MSAHDIFDQRLRAGLAAAAETVEPEIAALLDQVSARGRRHQTRGRVLLVVAAALAVVGGLSVGVALTGPHAPGPAGPGVSSASTASSPQSIAQLPGTYRAVIPPGETMIIDSEHLAGAWQLTFRTDGTVDVTGPAGYSGILTGVTWRSLGDLIELDLFGKDICKDDLPGTYRWTRTPDGLRWETASDHGCAARSNLLTNRLWAVVR